MGNRLPRQPRQTDFQICLISNNCIKPRQLSVPSSIPTSNYHLAKLTIPRTLQVSDSTDLTMPAPSPLKIATQAVERLVKEEKLYKTELSTQTERVAKLEADLKKKDANTDSNAEFMLKQEQQAVEETKAIFEPLNKRISEAVARLEEQIATAEGGNADADELTKAKESLAKAPKAEA
ncbi:tubulin binding cofactor A [Pseudomassariella vexata]|uniref:Tubulin-specific chaperone A n=1 Tax=Pseudomassariella vexata TaxID=1141098 RepID=A0A1Y2DE09_9PEZI|nr:tubulin binding cofactor A [Pseudomassariella vexata]ORY57500.1 tubulin binding cofactor A [Pseudomassariella vexata]